MKKVEGEMEDEMRIRSEEFAGEEARSWAKSFGGSVVKPEPDVAEVFPDAEAVTEALRFVIRETKENSEQFASKRGDA
jgi:hypothetical protein